MNVRYTDRAKDDLETAFSWYEKQRRGLGFEFLDCIEVGLKSILRFPEMYEEIYSNFRRCVVKRFPFSLFYTIEVNEIVIHSVFDNRQIPRNATNKALHMDCKNACAFLHPVSSAFIYTIEEITEVRQGK